jgi:hypothetical protein
MEVVGKTPATPFFPDLNYLTSCILEGCILCNDKKKAGLAGCQGSTAVSFSQDCPDNVARAFVLEAQPFDMAMRAAARTSSVLSGSLYLFAGGSMVRPVRPFMEVAKSGMSRLYGQI